MLVSLKAPTHMHSLAVDVASFSVFELVDVCLADGV